MTDLEKSGRFLDDSRVSPVDVFPTVLDHRVSTEVARNLAIRALVNDRMRMFASTGAFFPFVCSTCAAEIWQATPIEVAEVDHLLATGCMGELHPSKL